MDLIADRGRRVTVEELNTSRLLAHARKQAVQRKLDDMMIVDVDAHHYENEHFGDILPFMENEVFKQLSQSTRTSTRSRGTFTPQTIGYQDMGGRVTRYPMRGTEQTGDKGHMRDIELGHRWMDAMSVDYSCLFPTGMLRSACIRRRRWRSSCAGPTTAGSPRRCCRSPAAASSRC